MTTYDSQGRLLVSVTAVPASITPFVPNWAFKNRLTSSDTILTDYTFVTGPVLTLETGVTLTVQSNAWLVIVG